VRREQRKKGWSIMAAKRNAIERTLRKAQSVLASYIRPGARSAEESIDDLLRVLHDTRVVLMRTARKAKQAVNKTTGRGGKKRSTASRASVSRRAGTAKRRVSRKAAGPRRSVAAAQRTPKRRSAARKK
jgi:hypothetical protein